MKFKMTLIGLLASMMVFTSACSKDTGADTNTTSSGNSNKLEGTTLNVLIKTGYESEAITAYEEDFEEETGIELEIEVVDEPTLRKKFVLDSTSKTGAYDVVATQFWYMPEYIQGQFLEPLDTFIKDKPSEWLAADDISDGLKGTFKDADGKLYSLPVSASSGVLMYRKDLFEKYGIDVPKTTEDVLEAAKTLKEKLPTDTVPFVGRGESSSGSFGSSAGWAWAYGASVLDKEGNVTVTSPEMKQAISDWVTLMKDYGPTDASAMGWDTMSEMFRQGKAAMNFDMSGFPSVYTDPSVSSVADNVGVAIISGPANETAQWVYAEGLGISKYSKNKDAAWQFLQWRTSLDVAKQEAADGLRIDFPLDSIYETDEFKDATESLDFAGELPKIMSSFNSAYWPNVVEFDKLGQEFQKEISLAIEGKQDVDKALSNAQANVEAVVKK
ncbi:multiple sugar transport system substrate-binding protein [Bacillus niacini]|uniref:Multiple sugar transport system substrate-binding protein n=1 Tax=Neobacillus niacini TaxID=86668 RepID=A0A852TCL7_9BACI|nr:sugar ABC transporter substrate-binding protein [Neobacillus niacini]NYE05739.1 multiple sugar transport system substrate-binding protein [Neobacillus niacini]